MTPPRPATIPQLLDNRARTSSGTIHFLDASGNVTSSITLIELFSIAQRIASALVSSGLKGGGTDIIVTNFDNQRDHILLFWGCCFGKCFLLFFYGVVNVQAFSYSGNSYLPDCSFTPRGKSLELRSFRSTMPIRALTRSPLRRTVGLLPETLLSSTSMGIFICAGETNKTSMSTV